jgi:hypothetical protein
MFITTVAVPRHWTPFLIQHNSKFTHLNSEIYFDIILLPMLKYILAPAIDRVRSDAIG